MKEVVKLANSAGIGHTIAIRVATSTESTSFPYIRGLNEVGKRAPC